MGNNSLTIQLTPTGSGSRDYFISTYDKSGTLMERFGDLDLAYVDTNGEINFEFTDIMEEIHGLAKRSAIGAAAVLNELLADIVANDND
ncbi:hypothetical protein ACFONL_14125 [Camelimonas fluminis]|uniref:Uncharacterized protein n=1 Tax=Camelimonas fluminis TaxID=1576911 RepID=A0ABV7UIE8_9HYPH|nr:hypothetical protein [Camelimonas fluminis]